MGKGYFFEGIKITIKVLMPRSVLFENAGLGTGFLKPACLERGMRAPFNPACPERGVREGLRGAKDAEDKARAK
jgi:hypothetical protein